MKFKHYPLDKAEAEHKAGSKKRFRVTTINWSFATIRGRERYDTVHKNEYSWTLRNLIKFIRETEEVAEDIIAIEPEERAGRRRRGSR